MLGQRLEEKFIPQQDTCDYRYEDCDDSEVPYYEPLTCSLDDSLLKPNLGFGTYLNPKVDVGTTIKYIPAQEFKDGMFPISSLDLEKINNA